MQVRVIQCFSIFIFIQTNQGFFFPMLGGASNCQCQMSCNSPPPPMGCFCPMRMAGCSSAIPAAPVQQVYAPAVYQQPQISQYPSYVAVPSQPPPIIQQPQRVEQQQLPLLPPPPPPGPLGYGSQQQYVQSLAQTQQQVNLQPPTALQNEYMTQLLKVFESSTATTTKEYEPVNAARPLATTTSKPINYRPQPLAGKEIRTTEIKLIQHPYDENSSNLNVQRIPSTTTTQRAQVEPSLYSHEAQRGEGPTTTEINESGYDYTGTSSSLSPITLEYLQTVPRAPETEVDVFTKDVDKYHKNSVTVPLPTSTSYGATVAPPTANHASGYARDPRHLEEEERANSENEIYDELTREEFENGSENNSESEVEKPLKIKPKDQTISKCNNAKLKEAMHKKMTLSPAISKQMIYSAAADMFPGQTVNVICSKHSFSYIVVTSPVFCEHRKRPLTCFAFFQP
ncbi:unnamed protein product [Caenorhabditis angaria]|uniref:Ground-like domain-containing protein n=1 Tax=Caenorhabditis angaria TaxID=860376 RepID=A0A9P1IYM4_9PELO|nr:unnamed protein product [Caenorhabditis angaria]